MGFLPCNKMKSSLHLELLTPLEQTVIALTRTLYDPAIKDLVSFDEYRDALSDGQLISKDICAMKLEYQTFRKPIVVGGWFGLLASMIAIYHDYPVVSLDVSETATKVAGSVLGGRGTAVQADAYDYDYKGFDLVINTSTEHFDRPINDWLAKLKKGTLVVLQNNSDDSIDDHIQCFPTVEAFLGAVTLTEVLESFTIEFPQYNRHMIIGRV
jgi:hypothetical protein